MEYINIKGSVKLKKGHNIADILDEVKKVNFEDDGYISYYILNNWLIVLAEGLVRGEIANRLIHILTMLNKHIVDNSSITIYRPDDLWEMNVFLNYRSNKVQQLDLVA